MIGYFERHGRQDTIEKAKVSKPFPARRSNIEQASLRKWTPTRSCGASPRYAWSTNSPTAIFPARRANKRWEDVIVILNAGIDVLSTMNLQHLESLNDQMFQITGVQVRETVPDWVITEADEVVMIDLTPEALINRIKRGVVYDPKKAEQALNNFFKESKLSALRELALREAALQVDVPQDRALPADRILVHITPDPATAMLIRRGRRVADYLGAECLGVCVTSIGRSRRSSE